MLSLYYSFPASGVDTTSFDWQSRWENGSDAANPPLDEFDLPNAGFYFDTTLQGRASALQLFGSTVKDGTRCVDSSFAL